MNLSGEHIEDIAEVEAGSCKYQCYTTKITTKKGSEYHRLFCRKIDKKCKPYIGKNNLLQMPISDAPSIETPLRLPLEIIHTLWGWDISKRIYHEYDDKVYISISDYASVRQSLYDKSTETGTRRLRALAKKISPEKIERYHNRMYDFLYNPDKLLDLRIPKEDYIRLRKIAES